MLAGHHRACKKGDDRGPAEPEQRARRYVLCDACAGAVFPGFGERRHLNEVEVIEQSDPHHSSRDMQPASNAELYEVHHGCYPFAVNAWRT
jgi:hypothetical protein